MSTGLDWAALSKAYEARLDAEEQAGNDPVERRERRRREAEQAEIDAMTDEQRKERQRLSNLAYSRRKAAEKAASRGQRYATRPRKFDRTEMIDLFKQGLTNVEIAKKMGCGQSTVAQVIREAGFKQKAGRKPKDFCARGHEQKVHRRYPKTGTPYCGACKDRRTAEEKQKRHEAKAAREAAKK